MIGLVGLFALDASAGTGGSASGPAIEIAPSPSLDATANGGRSEATHSSPIHHTSQPVVTPVRGASSGGATTTNRASSTTPTAPAATTSGSS